MRRNLAIELSGPTAGDLAGTRGTSAVGSQAVVFDVISVSSNQSLAALRAAGVLPMADPSREVTQVDVAQPRGLADFGGA